MGGCMSVLVHVCKYTWMFVSKIIRIFDCMHVTMSVRMRESMHAPLADENQRTSALTMVEHLQISFFLLTSLASGLPSSL